MDARLTSLAAARFLLGAAHPSHFPADTGREVAFAGRSNAGKSSAINALTGRRALARVAKQPGRTRQINFFEVARERRLVDLPGYGYAKVSRAEKQRWTVLMEGYLRSRESLAAFVLIADVRRGVVAADELLLEVAGRARIPVCLVLSKADKLSRNEARAALLRARASTPDLAGLQLFSALRRTGVEELAERVCGWLSPVENTK